MRRIAAFYGRYSTDNQRVESIGDQLRVCLQYAERFDLDLPEKFVFSDEATTGRKVDRAGLNELFQAINENPFIQVVLVDELSRLSRNPIQALTLFSQFEMRNIELISVSENMSNKDESSKTMMGFKAIINNMELGVASHRVLRGILGQKVKGRSGGERCYGYTSVAEGEYRRIKTGEFKPEGMIHVIEPDEAKIVKQVFELYSMGNSPVSIAAKLNLDAVPAKRGGTWGVSTIHRMLKNERYIGIWVYGRTKTVHDPLKGTARQVLRPKEEWLHIDTREDLRIIPQELWESVQGRLAEATKPFPKRRSKPVGKNKSYIHAYPTHLFSGIMKCSVCGGGIMLVSGKGSGYYGCNRGYKLKDCSNQVLISRKNMEQNVIEKLKEVVLQPEALSVIFREVERLILNYKGDVPEKLQEVMRELNKLQAEIQNILRNIEQGVVSKYVNAALQDKEKKEENLLRLKEALQQAQVKLFKAPPQEWIMNRLEALGKMLNDNVGESAQFLRDLLGELVFTPVYPAEDKPYYEINAKLQTLALLKEDEGSESNSNLVSLGSNSMLWLGDRDSNPSKQIQRLLSYH